MNLWQLTLYLLNSKQNHLRPLNHIETVENLNPETHALTPPPLNHRGRTLLWPLKLNGSLNHKAPTVGPIAGTQGTEVRVLVPEIGVLAAGVNPAIAHEAELQIANFVATFNVETVYSLATSQLHALIKP